jgi:hypothetical protein
MCLRVSGRPLSSSSSAGAGEGARRPPPRGSAPRPAKSGFKIYGGHVSFLMYLVPAGVFYILYAKDNDKSDQDIEAMLAEKYPDLVRRGRQSESAVTTILTQVRDGGSKVDIELNEKMDKLLHAGKRSARERAPLLAVEPAPSDKKKS